jgi:uncharacterized membrane protein YfcA
MDGPFLVLFCFAAFAGGFVSGFSGFAMGLVVSGVWLHIITPVQTAALIAGYGLLTQGYGILKLRQALNWRAIWPLSLGTTIGIPIGVILLNYIDPVYLRLGVGGAGALRDLQPGAAGVQADDDRRSARHRHRRRQRPGRRTDRTGWRCLDHFLPMARLEAGCATGGVPTGAVRGLCGDLDFDGRHGRLHDGNSQIVRARSAVPARRPLERLQAVRKDRRRDVPQSGADTDPVRRPVADRAGRACQTARTSCR